MVLGAHGAVWPLSPRTINISEIGRVLISIYKGNFEPILMGDFLRNFDFFKILNRFYLFYETTSGVDIYLDYETLLDV